MGPPAAAGVAGKLGRWLGYNKTAAPGSPGAGAVLGISRGLQALAPTGAHAALLKIRGILYYRPGSS